MASSLERSMHSCPCRSSVNCESLRRLLVLTPACQGLRVGKKNFCRIFISTNGRDGRTRSKYGSSYACKQVTASSTIEVLGSNSLSADLEALLRDVGLTLDGLPVHPEKVESGIGLVAKREVRRGEEVFAVSRKHWISFETVKQSPIGKLVEGQRPWVALALFLIWERFAANSRWKTYLKMLPAQLNSTIFWSDEELSELEGTQLLSSTLAFKEYIGSEFQRIQREVLASNPGQLDPSVFTLEAFTWAFGILRSRTFTPLVGDDIALVPVADFINHDSFSREGKPSWEVRRGTGFFGSQDALVVKASKDLRAGAEVRMDYGSGKGNGQLALEYGFVESSGTSLEALFENQKRDSFTLTLEIAEGDRFVDDKLDVAEINGLGGSVSFEITPGQGPSEDMLTFLRLMVLDGPDAFLLEALFRDTVWGHISLPVSRENEEGLCTAMLDGCRSALEGYSTSIDEDLRMLSSGIDDPRLKMAVIVRLGEKRVLRELQEWFEGHIARLDKLEYYAERRLKDLGLMDDKGLHDPLGFQRVTSTSTDMSNPLSCLTCRQA